MSRPHVALLAAVSLAAAMIVALPARTLACTCMGLIDVEPDADASFIGRVASVGPPGAGPFGDYSVSFAVVEARKGVEGDTVELRAAGGGGGACGVDFAVGDRCKIYASRDAAGRLQTSLCSQNQQLGGFFAGFVARNGLTFVPALLIGSIGFGWLLFRRRDALMPAT